MAGAGPMVARGTRCQPEPTGAIAGQKGVQEGSPASCPFGQRWPTMARCPRRRTDASPDDQENRRIVRRFSILAKRSRAGRPILHMTRLGPRKCEFAGAESTRLPSTTRGQGER